MTAGMAQVMIVLIISFRGKIIVIFQSSYETVTKWLHFQAHASWTGKFEVLTQKLLHFHTDLSLKQCFAFVCERTSILYFVCFLLIF